MLDRSALDSRYLLGIEQQLKYVRRLGGTSELRVDRLIAAVVAALKEVGEPTPTLVLADEVGLIDHLGRASPDRILGESSCIVGVEGVVGVRRDAHDRPGRGDKRLEVRRLVFVSLAT